MATTEKYTTVIELNSEQAKRNLDELRKKVESWKNDLAEAREKKMGRSFIAAIRKELSEAEKELKKYDTEVARTIDTMNDLQSASVDRIEEAQKSLKRLASEVPHDSPFFDQLNEQLDMVTQELENIKATKTFEKLQEEASGATKSAEQLKAELTFIKDTAENAETASVRQLELAEKTAQNIKETSQKGSNEWNEANTSLEQIQSRLSAIEEEEKKVVTAIDRYNKELEQAGKKAEQVKSETELVDRTLGKLNSASVRDIEYSIKVLNEELRNTERTGDDVEKLTEKLKQLNEELKKVQDMQKPDEKKGNIFTRSINFLNTNWGAITQIIGAYSGIRDVVKGSVEAFAEMDQEMNNVRKYTGWTLEKVKELNEEFKNMETRTPREQLNQLAGSAGRLGITSKEGVKDFVYAADQINVALGDDLGQGAVDKIGKLTMAFGEDDTMGLRNAMLSTGSAVNELSQNSAANAGYLVEFAARLSGVGVQAGLTQAKILGLGAAMDENMQRDEMAATALSQIITKMTVDSETFARIAGKNVEKFSRLVKEDMNEALLQFFEAMNKKGGFTELAPLFEQMGLDGTRAIGVLSTLATKIDDVKRYQQLATEAYQEHTSVEAEAAIQNSTYQAKLEKTRKKFNDLRIELGEKLLPVASKFISAAGATVRILSVLAKFVLENKVAIVTLTAAIGGYVVAAKLQAMWTRVNNALFVTQIKLAKGFTGVTIAMGAALTRLVGKLSLLKVGLGLVAGAIAFVVSKFLLFRDAEKTVEGLAEANNVFNETLTGTRRSLEEDSRMLRKLIDADEDATEAVKELAEKYPQLVTEQMTAAQAYEALINASERYCEQLAYEKKAMSLENTLEDNYQQIKVYKEMLRDVEKELKASGDDFKVGLYRIDDLAQTFANDIEEVQKYMDAGYVPENLLDKYKMLYIRITKLTENNKVLSHEMEATKESMERQAKVAEFMDTIFGGIGRRIDSVKDKLGGLRNSLYDFLKKFTSGQKPEQTDQNPYYDTKNYWEKELDARKAALKALREDSTATATAIEEADKKVKEAQGKVDSFTGHKSGAPKTDPDKARRERERKANDAAKAETEQQLAELTHRYAMGQILYCDYIDEQERIQLEGIERRMLIYSKESLEYQKLAHKREEMLMNGSAETQKLLAANMKADHEQRLAAIEEQAWRENWTEQQKNERIFEEDMNFLDQQRILYRQGTLERINLEREISEKDQQHKLEREQYFRQQLEQAREQLLGMEKDRLMEIELKNINEVYDYMIKAGIAKEKERQEAILAIKAKYAGYKTTSERDQEKGSQMLSVASDAAKRENDGKKGSNAPFIGTIMQYQATMEKLKEMYGTDKENHAAYLAAKQQATSQFCQELAAQMQAAYNAVNQVMSAASSYYSAQQEYETAIVQRKYEKEIEAAGNNQKKVKKLQEQQAKEEAAIKTRYAKKAAAIQMAQAVAQTAISAINAYSSAAAIPVTGFVLAPIAAAMAIAAGALQIATIKKQQQAQAAGYYEGGFTGGRQYRKEAGVVHEGEFVANHQAVQNPNILPFLNFLDQAQRNNTVGSLTMQDVSRSMGAGGSTQVVAPIVNVQTDNTELHGVLEQVRDTQERLATQLEEGIGVDVPIAGENGVYHRIKEYEDLLKKK